MKTYGTFLLSMFGGLLLGMTLFLSAMWIAYGWEEATDSIRSMVIALGITAFVFFLFYRRRFKYLGSEELTPPVFSDTSFREFKIDVARFDFDYFKQLIEENFVVSGKSDNALKFRRRFSLWSWGAGAFLNYDKDAGKIEIHYFPISGYTRSATKAVKKMDNSLENLIRHSLNS